MSRLELRWRVRERQMPEQQTYRDYLDFVVDGTSLWDRLLAAMRRREADESWTTDLIGCLGWCPNKEWEADQAKQLLGEASSKLETGRTPVYVCPECGDIGCGAITCAVSKERRSVIWQRFAHEKNYRYDDDDQLFDDAGFEGIGPFRFDASKLRAVLLNLPAKEVNP